MAASRDQTRSAAQIGTAALLFSSVPVAIHLTVERTDPFLFNAAQWVGLLAAFAAYCAVSFRATFGPGLSLSSVLSRALRVEASDSRRAKLRAVALARPAVSADRTEAGTRGGDAAARLPGGGLRRLLCPFAVMVIAHANYAFYVWSARYIDIAVTTAVYEVWPAVMVVALSRYDAVAAAGRGRRISAAKKMLMVAAFAALAFVILGQAGGDALIPDRLGLGTVFGLVLACAAALLSGLLPVANMIYADTLASRCLDAATPAEGAVPRIELDSARGRRVSLWFTAFGLSAAAAVSVPIDIAAALSAAAAAPSGFGFTGRALLTGFALGLLVHGAGMLLLRVANLKSIDLGVNALFYATPLLALVWLVWAGVHLNRADLFWIGSAMVIAANALLQLNPEDEVEYAAVGADAPTGMRLGLVSLVLALWGFGAFVYVRDDIVPAGLLRWDAPEYWSLVGLSATVFALIYGFRAARLSARTADEDMRMLRVFRQAEAVCRQGRAPMSLLAGLRALDVASLDQLPDRYRRCCDTLRHGIGPDGLDEHEYARLQSEIDAFAHSRQQGRDLPELVAVFLFAGLTAVLALTTRPPLGASASAGVALLTELFAAVLVAVVMYLAFGLLDMRRERFIPLLARHDPRRRAADGAQEDFGILFRYRSNTRAQRAVSLVLVAAMVAMHAALLRHKWS